MRCRAPLGVTAALLVVAAVSTLGVAPARADDGTDITRLKYADGALALVVDVPRGAEVDPDAADVVVATIGGREYPAEAGGFDEEDDLRRTAILAIDTSKSMAGKKFEAAKQAAMTFIDVVPDDVSVGIVTFDDTVDTVVPPTQAHEDAVAALETLSLATGTRLYDALAESVRLAGSAGAGSVLLLSDGRDTTGAAADDVQRLVDDSDVAVNAVSLGRSARDRRILAQISGADGEVIPADAASLEREFQEQAEGLARQVSVTIEVPGSVLVDPVPVEITLASTSGPLTDRTLFQLPPQDALEEAVPPPVFDVDGGGALPSWVMYLAAALVAAAVLLVAAAYVPAAPPPASAEARIAGYGSGLRRGGEKDEAPEPVLTQATEAIDVVLRRNQGLEERISARLTSAGSPLKASEWLLLHAGLVVVAILLGFLLGRGTPILVVLFTVIGVVLPWFWLGLRRGRRRQKFESALPETLQLMAGSLSAGLSMLQAIDTIVREGTDPVASEFRRVLIEIRLGVPLDDALEGVAERFDSSDFRWVVMAIRIQRQVGGNLAELLTTVAGTIREREFIRRQVDSLAAEGKLSAVVLGGLPPAFLLYLVVAQPSYVEPLFTDLRGLIMLVFSAVWLSIGIVWMSRLVKVEV